MTKASVLRALIADMDREIATMKKVRDYLQIYAEEEGEYERVRESYEKVE